MSLALDPDTLDHLKRYNRLVEERKVIVVQAQNWMDFALKLVADLSVNAEKQEVAQLRQAFIADLKVALGLP